MKYGFIGCGNMGGAIATALSNSTKSILLANRTHKKAELLAKKLGLSSGTNEEAAGSCEFVFLGVKPQMAEDVLLSIKDTLTKNKPVLVSMLAGTSIQKLEALTGGELPIIRILPNTPVAVGKGIVLYCRSKNVTEEKMNEFLSDMSPCGFLDEISESLIDAGSCLSGCAPAFMYMFISALSDGAVAAGLPRSKALTYAAMTMAGSAELVLKSGKHPEQLKDEVCSPGGTTIMGVKALEEGGFRDCAMSAILAAYNKTKDMR